MLLPHTPGIRVPAALFFMLIQTFVDAESNNTTTTLTGIGSDDEVECDTWCLLEITAVAATMILGICLIFMGPQRPVTTDVVLAFLFGAALTFYMLYHVYFEYTETRPAMWIISTATCCVASGLGFIVNKYRRCGKAVNGVILWSLLVLFIVETGAHTALVEEIGNERWIIAYAIVSLVFIYLSMAHVLEMLVLTTSFAGVCLLTHGVSYMFGGPNLFDFFVSHNAYCTGDECTYLFAGWMSGNVLAIFFSTSHQIELARKRRGTFCGVAIKMGTCSVNRSFCCGLCHHVHRRYRRRRAHRLNLPYDDDPSVWREAQEYHKEGSCFYVCCCQMCCGEEHISYSDLVDGSNVLREAPIPPNKVVPEGELRGELAMWDGAGFLQDEDRRQRTMAHLLEARGHAATVRAQYTPHRREAKLAYREEKYRTKSKIIHTV